MNDLMVVIGMTALCKVLDSLLRMGNLWSVYQVGVNLTFGRARKYRGSGCASMQLLYKRNDTQNYIDEF